MSPCPPISDGDTLDEPLTTVSPDRVPDPLWKPGSRWLTTPRTAPAWHAALTYLDDDQWHPIADLHDAMLQASDLAPRTIEGHLRSASRRGWINIRRGKVRLRNRTLVEAALDHVDGVS